MTAETMEEQFARFDRERGKKPRKRTRSPEAAAAAASRQAAHDRRLRELATAFRVVARVTIRKGPRGRLSLEVDPC
jgi:hypothetical protein